MMTFEHPLGRFAYNGFAASHSAEYWPSPPGLPARSLGGSIIGDRQAEMLSSIAIGTIVGAVAGSWYAGGRVTKGRSNDVWGGMIGGLVGLLSHQGITGFGPDGGTIGPEGWAP